MSLNADPLPCAALDSHTHGRDRPRQAACARPSTPRARPTSSSTAPNIVGAQPYRRFKCLSTRCSPAHTITPPSRGLPPHGGRPRRLARRPQQPVEAAAMQRQRTRTPSTTCLSATAGPGPANALVTLVLFSGLPVPFARASRPPSAPPHPLRQRPSASCGRTNRCLPRPRPPGRQRRDGGVRAGAATPSSGRCDVLMETSRTRRRRPQALRAAGGLLNMDRYRGHDRQHASPPDRRRPLPRAARRGQRHPHMFINGCRLCRRRSRGRLRPA